MPTTHAPAAPVRAILAAVAPIVESAETLADLLPDTLDLLEEHGESAAPERACLARLHTALDGLRAALDQREDR